MGESGGVKVCVTKNLCEKCLYEKASICKCVPGKKGVCLNAKQYRVPLCAKKFGLLKCSAL